MSSHVLLLHAMQISCRCVWRCKRAGIDCDWINNELNESRSFKHKSTKHKIRLVFISHIKNIQFLNWVIYSWVRKIILLTLIPVIRYVLLYTLLLFDNEFTLLCTVKRLAIRANAVRFGVKMQYIILFYTLMLSMLNTFDSATLGTRNLFMCLLSTFVCLDVAAAAVEDDKSRQIFIIKESSKHCHEFVKLTAHLPSYSTQIRRWFCEFAYVIVFSLEHSIVICMFCFLVQGAMKFFYAVQTSETQYCPARDAYWWSWHFVVVYIKYCVWNLS